MKNLFADLPPALPNELVEILIDNQHVRIERIISFGHATPADGSWYDQEQSELVVVLSGRAKLQFEGKDRPVEMGPGDFLNIPAHCRHRVTWTSPVEPTIWLAVFYSDQA